MKLKKYIVPVCLFSLIALMIRECSMAEWDAQEAKVKELIERRASKEEVIAALGTRFGDYSRGGSGEQALKTYFAREPNKLLEVQDKAKKWPNIMCYSTPYLMTWLFLDENQRLVDYAMSAQ